MIIPNDNGVDYRLLKFVEYQHAVPPVHRELLIEYSNRKKLDENDKVLLSWLMANTYHEITSILFFEEIEYGRGYNKRFEEFWNKNNERITFGTAKKYNKMNNRILDTIEFFYSNYGLKPFKSLISFLKNSNSSIERYELIKEINKNCKNFGRFSEDLFLEILQIFDNPDTFDINIKASDVFDWEHCANLTSAVFNIMYLDELADRFDSKDLSKTELGIWEPKLKEKVLEIQSVINKTYNTELDTSLFITKLCSFRNLFKNNRYGGYHHDRQLEYLIKYEQTWPEKKELWAEIYDIRKQVYGEQLLGELGGWNGIRKERKKLWTTKGLTGVEYD